MGPDTTTLANEDMINMIPKSPSNNETVIKISRKDWNKLISNINGLT